MALRLFRVVPWIREAREGDPGHPLHVPGPQGAGRVDNPERYAVLYASDSATGAVAESFGNLAVWSDQMFVVPSMGARRALATYELHDGVVLDLDDARALLHRDIRPSRVVTRDRAITQRWALGIYDEGTWQGVRWWSYVDPDRGSFGLWDRRTLRVLDVTPLERTHPAVGDAAAALPRTWAKERR